MTKEAALLNIRYFVLYTVFQSDGRPVLSVLGLSCFRSQYYNADSDARAYLEESVSLLVANGFDLISPDGAISPKLMCPDGLHVIRLEVVRCLEIEGVMLTKS